MTDRPPHNRGEIPEGYEVAAVPDPHWRIEAGRRCRHGGGSGHKACGKPSAASFARGTYRTQWWAYCPDHMFGRWIEDGTVMCWILRKIGGEGA